MQTRFFVGPIFSEDDVKRGEEKYFDTGGTSIEGIQNKRLPINIPNGACFIIGGRKSIAETLHKNDGSLSSRVGNRDRVH